jgi:hypothetical protein
MFLEFHILRRIAGVRHRQDTRITGVIALHFRRPVCSRRHIHTLDVSGTPNTEGGQIEFIDNSPTSERTVADHHHTRADPALPLIRLERRACHRLKLSQRHRCAAVRTRRPTQPTPATPPAFTSATRCIAGNAARPTRIGERRGPPQHARRRAASTRRLRRRRPQTVLPEQAQPGEGSGGSRVPRRSQPG